MKLGSLKFPKKFKVGSPVPWKNFRSAYCKNIQKEYYLVYIAAPPPPSMGCMFQNPQWAPDTTGNTEPYIYCFFPMRAYL